MKCKKTMISILVCFGILASSFPVYANCMHIDINDQGPGHVSDIIVYQGDSSKIKAECWIDTKRGSIVDSWSDLDMNIFDLNGTKIFFDRKETDISGNCYFNTPSNLTVGTYQIKIKNKNEYRYPFGNGHHAETSVNLIVRDPVKDNPNICTGYWSINVQNVIQGEKQLISANFVNTTRMANYKNQTPDKNSKLGNVTYTIFDSDGNIVKNCSLPLKLVNGQIEADTVLDTSDLIPGNYSLLIQFRGNNFVSSGAVEKTFTLYSNNITTLEQAQFLVQYLENHIKNLNFEIDTIYRQILDNKNEIQRNNQRILELTAKINSPNMGIGSDPEKIKWQMEIQNLNVANNDLNLQIKNFEAKKQDDINTRYGYSLKMENIKIKWNIKDPA